MNKRAEIRQKIVDILEIAIPTVPVFNQRYAAVKNLPAIIVNATGDTVEYTDPENMIRRDEKIQILIYENGLESHEQLESGKTPVIDKLQSIIDKVETALIKYRENLESTVYLFRYESTKINTNIDGEYVNCQAVMTFNANYNDVL